MSRRPFRVGRARTASAYSPPSRSGRTAGSSSTRAPAPARTAAKAKPAATATSTRSQALDHRRQRARQRRALRQPFLAIRMPTVITSKSASSSRHQEHQAGARDRYDTASIISRTSSGKSNCSARAAASGATSAPSNCDAKRKRGSQPEARTCRHAPSQACRNAQERQKR